MKNRIASDNINTLNPGEIFVFGSNEAGIHGAGAARIAYDKFGAIMGKGYGLNSRSFAIPTKDGSINTLALSVIGLYINDFIKIAKSTPQYTYLVTQIGCGLAGYLPEEIAPLFKNSIEVDNIHLPESFWEILNNLK